MIARAFPFLLAIAGAGPAAQTSLVPPAPAAGSIDGLPLASLPKQALPATGCAAYLWTRAESRALVAMATADPAQLRLSLGGRVVDVPRVEQQGVGGFGFSGVTEYRSGDVTAILDMSITTRADLKDGAAVPDATLRLDRVGQDSVVIPVAGIIGCV